MNTDPDHEVCCYGKMKCCDKDYYIRIKGRGNSTWGQKKKPYNFTVYEDKLYHKKMKVNLLDQVTAHSYSVLAAYVDRTSLRNKLIYDLGLSSPPKDFTLFPAPKRIWRATLSNKMFDRALFLC